MGGSGGAGSDDNRKQNHCEIEKRRRDKMNHYITELASVIPAFSNNQSKLDKLTVLRMAVQHVKSLRSSLCSFSSFHLRPSFLSSGNLLKNLILQMASQEAQDNLFMVVTCDRGKVLFVSESSKDILNQDQHELVGQSLFDILHKDDVCKVKEQISYFNLLPREMLVDSRTLQPIKSNQMESFFQLQNQANSTLQPGSRRSFFCRMKCGRIWPPPEKSSPAAETITTTSSSSSSSAARATSATTRTSNSAIHATSSKPMSTRNTSSGSPAVASGSADSKQAAVTKFTSNQKSQPADLAPTTMQPKSSISETMIGSKSQPSGKPGARHIKSSMCHTKRSERHHHHHHLNYHHQIHQARGRHQKEFNKLSNSSESDEAKYPNAPGSTSTSSSSVPSSSRHNSSDSGVSSAPTARKCPNKSSRTSASSAAAKTKQQHLSNEIKMDLSDEQTAAVEFGAKKISQKSSKTKHVAACDDRGGRLNLPVGNASGDKGSTNADGGCMNNQWSSISGAASQGTASNDDNAQRSTPANESSPLSTSSSSSSSPFSTNTKKNDKDSVRCKNRRASGKTPLSGGGGGGAGVSTSAVNNIGANNGVISFNRKQWRYIVMHCTGYLKSITVRNDEYDDEDDDDADYDERNMTDAQINLDEENDTDNCRLNDNQFRTIKCLVAVCRRSVMDRYLKPDRPLTFTCRYSMEGKFTFIDQRTTVALGYMPQQLVGTSHYAYCHEDSVNTFKECHRQCILNSETVSSDIYQFRRSNGQHLWLQTSLKCFRNPWTKLIDYIVANHTTAEGSDPRYNEGCVPTKFNRDMTGEASQSSSPASSTSISCIDSKKSASPSSSSIGSSYSIDSYASGANIQALLNQIDRVKSGSWQHPFKSNKRRGDSHHHHAVGSSGSSSARKSNDDSGNYSDLQSCSSISSQNSGTSSTGGYLNMQSASNFNGNNNPSIQTRTAAADRHREEQRSQPLPQPQPQPQPPPRQQQQQQQQQSQMLVTNDSNRAPCLNDAYNFDQGQKVLNMFNSEPNSCEQENYHHQANCPPPPVTGNQQICGQQTNFNANTATLPSDANHAQYVSTDTCKGISGPRIVTVRLNRPPVNWTSAIKPLQRPYLYSYRAPQMKHNNMANINDQRSWSANQNADYSNSLARHQSSRTVGMGKNEVEQRRTVACTLQNENEVQQSPYGLQQQQLVPLAVMQTQMPTLPSQQSGNFDSQLEQQLAYPNGLMQPINHFMTPGSIETPYTTDGLAMEHQLGHQQVANRHLQQDNLATMTLSQQQQTSQQVQQQQQSAQRSTQHQQSNIDMSIPMVWNSDGSSYQTMNTMHGGHHQMAAACHQNNDGTNSNDVDGSENRGNVNMIGMNVIDNSNHQLAMPINQEIGQCQQCTNHKCCPAQNNQHMIMNNNGDLNSMYLSSLAVDDLDEGELLECLAACDSNAQLYNIQNNTYSTQYNIYREQ